MNQQPAHQAEFDEYASGYDSGMDNSLKRALGNSAEDFIAIKVYRLDCDLRRRPPAIARPAADWNWLDLGCGTGVFLRLLRRHGVPGAFRGCDVSQGMLDEARAAWDAPQPAVFEQISESGPLPYADQSFDVVLVSAVLHHVPVADRPSVYREVARVLRPGGRVYVFEHNPLNPVTSWVVSHTEIDRNAILLRPGEVKRGLGDAQLSRIWTSGLMYFPPRWRFAWPIDRGIGWLPLGGQYMVAGDRA